MSKSLLLTAERVDTVPRPIGIALKAAQLADGTVGMTDASCRIK
jgi:hypothetical protein